MSGKPSARRWLMKTEPDEFSLDDLRAKGTGRWDGVRNFEARNHLRAMRMGDRCLIYHSNAAPSGVAGIATVVREAYADPTQFDPASDYHDPRSSPADPRWSAVDVGFVSALPRLVALAELRACAALAGMELFRRNRLSVVPVTADEWRIIERLAAAPPRPAKG